MNVIIAYDRRDFSTKILPRVPVLLQTLLFVVSELIQASDVHIVLKIVYLHESSDVIVVYSVDEVEVIVLQNMEIYKNFSYLHSFDASSVSY